MEKNNTNEVFTENKMESNPQIEETKSEDSEYLDFVLN